MKNRKIKIVSLFLSVILLIGFLLPSFQKNVFYELDSNENIRTVNTDELLNTSLGDAMEEFLNQFDEYECIVDEGQGQILVRETKYLDDITEVYETYINYLDSEITEFNITINTCCNNEIIQEESYIAQLCYNEEDDEFYIDFEGELISISEIIETDVLENCIAIVDDLAVAIAVLAVASVIICYPYIETVVTTVVTTVINWVRSFWRWLRGVFVTKTVTTTIVTTVTYYQVNVFSRDFELEKVENADEAPRDADFYYLAVVIGPDVYISLEKITESEAVAVLATDTDVSIDGTEFQLTTYTQAETDAQNIAMQAANYNGYSSITRHRYHGGSKAGVYFEHYHPAPSSVHGLPHSFFGSPEIRV